MPVATIEELGATAKNGGSSGSFPTISSLQPGPSAWKSVCIKRPSSGSHRQGPAAKACGKSLPAALQRAGKLRVNARGAVFRLGSLVEPSGKLFQGRLERVAAAGYLRQNLLQETEVKGRAAGQHIREAELAPEMQVEEDGVPRAVAELDTCGSEDALDFVKPNGGLLEKILALGLGFHDVDRVGGVNCRLGKAFKGRRRVTSAHGERRQIGVVEFDGESAVEHLGAERMGGLVHVRRADHSQVVRQLNAA